ncbi:MAG: metallophosphoesterase [Phycisphaerales bacterium]|nr:metallophosphoesterase [Phycisphaerales bacterium]
MQFQTDFTNAAAVIQLLGQAARTLRESPLRRGSTVHLPRRGRLVATGDLHDNPYHLESILALARLDASIDHHVTLHELIHGENLINGMDFSHRMLLRAAELVVRYPLQVHPLLANHEMSQMTGRGVSKGAGDSVILFNDAIEFTFGDDAAAVIDAINGFLRAWPLALRTDSGILCSHSLPAEHVMKTFDPGVLDRELEAADFEPRTGSAYLLVWGRRHSSELLDRLAELLGVSAFCIGHEHAESGSQPLDHRGIILNSDHERAAVLVIDLAADPQPDEWVWAVLPLASLEPPPL